MATTFYRTIVHIAIATGFIALYCRSAAADTGASLLLRPGATDQRLEVQGGALLLDSGYTRETDFDFQLSLYESSGRYRFDPAQQLGPRVGYDALWLNLDTDHPALPDHLADLSLGYGMAFAKSEPWWFAASVGAGYAGDSLFSDSKAWYGKADLLVGRDWNNGILLLVLDYDGNRTIYPDIPLPGVAYQAKFTDEISYVVGLPFSSVTWEPKSIPQLRVDAAYSLPDTFTARVVYKFTEQFQVFGALDNLNKAFHIDGTSDTRRLFFEQKRVEAGFRWAPIDRLAFSAGVGYAFNQELLTGFDSRNLTSVTEISDEPFARLQVEWRP